MPNETHNALLNQLLINLGRSLLQYICEAWPWTSDLDVWEREKIKDLAARQQTQIAKLADFLAERDWPVDFGTYPTEYTDLHYVALDYLMSQLIENEDGLISDLEKSIQACSDDPEAGTLLKEILHEQREIVRALQDLQQRRDERSSTPAA